MAQTAVGDHQAFRRLVERHQQRVWHVAYRSLGDGNEAEDVAQETFLRVFNAAARYRPTARFTTYLYSIVTRLCIDRSRKHRPRLTDQSEETPTETSPTAPLEQIERDHEIHRAIRRLPAKQRLAIVLRYERELPLREISEIMNITPKGVERLLARGRHTLASQLTELKDFA
jgi:RNA polymerase sigma-70 factor (ECF subfamily)